MDDPNAYRGVALECALFKIMTKILTERLTIIYQNNSSFSGEEGLRYMQYGVYNKT